jgi:membrane-associated PAP2 superfamily phosphatase
MNRTGLLIALAVAVAVGLPFGLYPELDLKFAALFFDPEWMANWFAVGMPQKWVRDAARGLITLVAVPAFIALVLKILVPRRPMLLPGRAALLMIITLALAPGLVANVILKEHWSRPRPIDVAEFGGFEHFVAWWDPRGDCPKNCSFVGGEAAGAFWTLAPAALTPPALRPFAYAAALAFGSAVGALRMAGGGHFFTDVVFAGVFTFLIVWIVHGLLYRWRRTRVTDEAVERALARIRGRAPPDA